jgi:predicted transposase YbfD/YdcC
LDVSVLQDCAVTIDAMGCQWDIAEKIVSKQADCLLAVKGSQASPEEDVERTVRYYEGELLKTINTDFHVN